VPLLENDYHLPFFPIVATLTTDSNLLFHMLMVCNDAFLTGIYSCASLFVQLMEFCLDDNYLGYGFLLRLFEASGSYHLRCLVVRNPCRR
jgi:hypothetical protein